MSNELPPVLSEKAMQAEVEHFGSTPCYVEDGSQEGRDNL